MIEAVKSKKAKVKSKKEDKKRNSATKFAIQKISDTQQYKMYGNAVTVDIVKMIAERL